MYDGNFKQSYFVKPEKPIAYLRHEATRSNIAVYRKMGYFQRFMIQICFGLKYIELTEEERSKLL